MKTTDTRTLHRINNVCCAVAREKIITGGVNSIKVTWGFRDVYPGLSQNIDPMLNLLGKMNLQTPCWINWNLLDRTPVVSILLFPRAVIKQFINWLMSKIFWNTVRNFFFSACQPRVYKVFETFDKNFMVLTSMIFFGLSQDAPS